MKTKVFLATLILSLLVIFVIPVLVTHSQEETVKVGYSEIQPTDETSMPTGSALFSFQNSTGVLVWEAAVEAPSRCIEPSFRRRHSSRRSDHLHR